jgi:complex iron-sulfur molybdoenzyme family reductase subunit gamma
VESDKNSSNSHRVIIGEGKKSINEIKREDLNSSAKIEYISGGWRAMLLHPLKDKYMDINTSTAVSFSVWDGYKKDKNSTKFFSSWVGVGLDASKDDPFLASLSIKLKADASKGKELFKNFCASCHRTKYFQSAPINKAPNLSNVGGFSTVSYLLESIVNPDAIVVCDQKNRDKINYFWYTISENGERKSIMPSFSNLESKSLTNLVAYLKTLKIDTRK